MNTSRKIISILVMALILSFFFLYAQVPLIRFLSLMIPGFILLALLHSLLSSAFIEVRRDEDVLRGIKLKDIEIRLHVRNRFPFPVTYFTLNDARGELFSEGGTFLVSLNPWEKKVLTYTLRGHQRGYYDVGPVTIKGSDFLGLFPWKRKFDVRSHVVVYPSIYPIALLNKQGLPAGSLKINNKMYEDVTQFRSLREYVPGDDMKRINWKASAKTSKLYTMEYDSTLYFPVLVVLNFSLDDYPNRYKVQLMERAAEVAASVAFYYVDLKQEIGFVSTGNIEGEDGYKIVPSKAGYEHAQEIMEVIARLAPASGRADFNHLFFQSGVQIPMGVKILIITPRPEQKEAQVIIGLKRRGYNVNVMQIESSIVKQTEDYLTGAVNVFNVREMGKEVVNG